MVTRQSMVTVQSHIVPGDDALNEIPPLRLDDGVPVVLPDPHPLGPPGFAKVHLVVVTTRTDSGGSETADVGKRLVTRFWQPREGRWVEYTFESLEHAKHVFVVDHGWVLRQQQPLDIADAHELIFETVPEELMPPTAAEVLQADVGLPPDDVAELLERVDRRVAEETGGGSAGEPGP
jgi:hypothetical protein